MADILLSVSGMTCAACSGSVTEALESVTGVESAAVSLLTNEARVTPRGLLPLDPAVLVAAVEDCGFDCTLVSGASAAAETTIVAVSGMTCGACSSSIAAALEQLDGVLLVAVSLLTNTAKIVHSALVPPATLVAAIEDCGFDAQLESCSAAPLESRFEVSGMTCGACSASITEALQKLPGVVSVNVLQITNAAAVTHDASLSPQEIKDAIEDCGFDALIVSSTQNQTDSVQEIVLQIHGIGENTDLPALQYNVEAAFSGLPGVQSFTFMFKGQAHAHELAADTSDLGPEKLVDELSVSLTKATGVRLLLDTLNSIDLSIYFIISNSIDQSMSAQLKLLSKTKDIDYWRRNFFHALLAGLPILLLSMTESLRFWKNMALFHGLYVVSLLQFALATYVLFVLGAVFFKKFMVFLRHKGKNANMDVLVCISTSISYVFSIFSIFLGVWTGQTTPPKVLFDTIAMLICFISFGKWIENRAKGATSSALSRLMSLTPTNCVIVTDEHFQDFVAGGEKAEMAAELETRTISIDLIQKDDIAVVAPGGKIPADGVIIYGDTEVDESILTGESLPVHKKVGDVVIGGSINGAFLIYMRVTEAGRNSQLHQIINIVKESQVNKAPVQRFADYIASRFVAAVLCLSLATLLFWLCLLRFYPNALPKLFTAGANGKYFVSLKLAISVIVVACPCALGLAAPTAVMVGTGVGAGHGALIKGGDVLEAASRINVILFDKTGTLTRGEIQVTRHRALNMPELDWWKLVGSVEIGSEHPTGRAIAQHAKTELSMFEGDTFDTRITDFNVVTGMGVTARVIVGGKAFKVAVGNQRMVVKNHPEARAALAATVAEELSKSVSSVSHVVIDETYCGYLELSDTIKACAKDTLDYLQHVEQFQVGMITGDNSKVAHRIGQELGIPRGNIFSEVSPIDKDKVVSEIRDRFGGSKNVSIAFVGDGINDAPALVQADIGMAISTGTDIAIDLAEIVLMGSQGKTNDLYGVITALQVSKATFSKIKWNFFCATIYNVFMLPFAMGCFMKLGLMLSPGTAAAAMACSSISVVLNSLMLKYWQPPRVSEMARVADERALGADFSLLLLSLAEFNEIKRGSRKARAQRMFAIFRTSFKRVQEYELVEN